MGKIIVAGDHITVDKIVKTADSLTGYLNGREKVSLRGIDWATFKATWSGVEPTEEAEVTVESLQQENGELKSRLEIVEEALIMLMDTGN
ncbi:hypothetical protein [Peribacillus butanolivorans]|uniref:Uncharacterized protein n=1 Tax=Peribacillus butanolivorans TaxID=421767 RepID=A0ABM6XPK0_9BACI|nr:hypothetical protein [Peribacillus butanolivorans]AXN39865.1 hypothetical protein DTO10_16855 [Peribacillus butanolivorans]